ncbi:MAG: EAL domain-containing protein [Gammaproteobacteria bacterium]|nr:EAL domain-containing protein [Gammaproteobacteria bacterium]NIY32834.1 EAL domain-containing protein [Gammaproteobacteria bacterium]
MHAGCNSSGLETPFRYSMTLRTPLYLLPVLVGAFLAAAVALLDYLAQERYQAQRRSETIHQLSTVRARLEGGLSARLHLTQGLVTHVAGNPGITEVEFRRLARGLITGNNGIRAVLLAGDTGASHVYPKAANRPALGLRLLDIPRQRAAIRRALQSRGTVVIGPVQLTQGGTVFISRTPIYLGSPSGELGKGEYWGLVTILIDARTLLAEAGLSGETLHGLRYALRGADGLGARGEVFFGHPRVFDAEPMHMTVDLPNGAWQLAAVPVGGWQRLAPYTLWWRFAGVLLAVLGSLATRAWVRYPHRLRGAVHQATAALDRARQQLENRVAERTAELVEANQALGESEARLAEAQRIAQIGSWEWDLRTGGLHCSDEIYRIFGLGPQPSDADYEIFLGSIHSEDRAQVKAAVRDALRRRKPYAIDCRVVHLDGTERVVHGQGHVEFTAAGEPVRIVGIVQDITARQRVERQLAHMAYYDGLTALPNRVLLRDRLEHAMARAHRSSEKLALILLDLDRFKNVNDSLGHDIGDRLLIRVARRLGQHMREGDTLARLGGDEFTILLEDAADVEHTATVAAKLLRELTEPFVVGDHELFVSASLGVSMHPDDGTDVESLMKNADAAMYRAKERGGDGYQFYSSEMSVQAHERLALEASLRRATERGEFELHYQPVLDLGTDRIVALEALIRWHRPGHGLMGPEHFIPVAEETGSIVPMGRWALHAACEHWRSWEQDGLPPVRVMVNLSARQFGQTDLADELERLLHLTGVAPQYLGVEITETILLKQDVRPNRILEKLKQMGVHVAVDDFGTGHSALVYLKRLAIDCLKIDRTFVCDVTTDSNDAAIVQAIVAMAHQLGLRVVAEGVESVEQEEAVRRYGCDWAQGELYSRPVPAHAVPALLRRTRRRREAVQT